MLIAPLPSFPLASRYAVRAASDVRLLHHTNRGRGRDGSAVYGDRYSLSVAVAALPAWHDATGHHSLAAPTLAGEILHGLATGSSQVAADQPLLALWAVNGEPRGDSAEDVGDQIIERPTGRR